MTQYIVRRLLMVPILLLGITAITFVMYNLAPGDPVSAMIDPADPVMRVGVNREAMLERLGLNKPIHVRYAIWLGELLQGNMGFSYRTKEPVAEMIGRVLPNTLMIQGVSIGLAILIGLALGVASALKRYSALDHALTVVAFFGLSVPSFFIGLLMMYVFAVKLKWFPVAGMWTPGKPTGFTLDLLHHLALPAGAQVMMSMAGYMRYMRTSMLDALSGEYVTTARAKGLSEPIIMTRHVLRNALLPVVTIVGLSLPGLLGGSFIIESLFAWPGMGLLGYKSLIMNDYSVLMGVALISATLVLLANLAADIAYGVVDPRVRYD